jgi:arylsulfatase A-like enzyme
MVRSGPVKCIPLPAGSRATRKCRRRIAWALVISAIWLGTTAAQATAPGEGSRPATVVLISMDGTRPADLRPDVLPSLVALAQRGARAERLIPEFPTNTFPNHVTLITGVSPERHGIVSNAFIDPLRGMFEKREIPTWIQVAPIWSLLAERGIPSAALYWVGSEGSWRGRGGPRYWRPFSSATREEEKVEQILAWLDLPPEERPRLITSWFHGADHAGHVYGPGTSQVAEVLREQDKAISSLVAGLDARELWGSTTLIFVSDHGMTTATRRVDLGSRLRDAGIAARVLGIGGFASVYVESAARARGVEVARGLGLSAWIREEAPESLRVRHPRFGDVVVVAPLGTAIVREGLVLTGFHGYPPELPEMSAIMLAAGRRVPSGLKLSAVRSVDIAPTVLSLLDTPVPEWMEGRPIAAFLPRTSRSRSSTLERERNASGSPVLASAVSEEVR